MTSRSCLKTKLLLNSITAVRRNNKRPIGQSVFDYINKTSATNMNQILEIFVKFNKWRGQNKLGVGISKNLLILVVSEKQTEMFNIEAQS